MLNHCTNRNSPCSRIPTRTPTLRAALSMWVMMAGLFSPGGAFAEVESTLQTEHALSRHGITWTFDRPYPVGRFVNGDWWVVGPVKIVKIDPACRQLDGGRIVHGSMIDPIVSGDVGFDSTKKYKPELNVALGLDPEHPLEISPGKSLLSAVSIEKPGGDASLQTQEGGIFLETIAVLTVLDAAPPEDTFRPPYVAGEKKLHRLSQVDVTKLPALKVVGERPTWEQVNALVERPFIDFAPNWGRYHLATKHNGKLYGRDVSKQVGQVSVMLMTDAPPAEKRTALIGLIQRGIDLYGIFSYWNAHRGDCPFPWRSDGGHSSGRKWPIIFAGAMLGDEGMTDVALTAPGMFHEDAQTVYIGQRHVDASNGPSWKPPYGGKRGKQPYAAEMIGMPEWIGNIQTERANANWFAHPYRLSGNQNTFYGVALSVLAMGLKDKWNHDVWFDYQARYAAIMDNQPDPFAALLGYKPVDGAIKEGGWASWQKVWNGCGWQYEMWRAHWSKYYQMPTAEALRQVATEPDAK